MIGHANLCGDFRHDVQVLIQQNYVLTNTKRIMRDVERQNKIINIIIVDGKVYVHLTKNKGMSPNLFHLKKLIEMSI